MKKIEYKLLAAVTDEILQLRYQCFNEIRGIYENTNTALERFDANAFHLAITIDGELAGYTRLTPYPHNFMFLSQINGQVINFDNYTIEFGRTFVVPNFRGIKLLNLLFLVALHICDSIGYSTVMCTEPHLTLLQMPESLGFKYNNAVADFYLEDCDKEILNEYVLACNLIPTKQLRKEKINDLKNWFLEKGYLLELL